MFRSNERKLVGKTAAMTIILLLCIVILVLFQTTIMNETCIGYQHLSIEFEKNGTLNTEHLRQQDQTIRRKRLPQAIIIGTRKSGTRALLKFIDLNLDIRVAHKEVHFFDKYSNYKRGLDWYRDQMPASRVNELTIEKSPAYFVTPEVPERIKSMNSSIKLIVIFRDPVTRLISDYSQLIANKLANAGDLDTSGDLDSEADYANSGLNAISDDDFVHPECGNSNKSIGNSIQDKSCFWTRAEKNFERYVLRPDGGIDDQRRAVRVGMYSNYLERWRAIFPTNQFHFVDGEILITNPYEELHKLELFLGLEPTIRPEHFVFNQRKGFYCLATNMSGSIPAKSLHQQTRRSIARSGDSSAPIVNCLSRSKGRRHVQVKRELIGRLQKFYAPYNEYLYSLTGQNFNWTQDEKN